ncbi:type II secretion system protein [Paraliobacillus salinarum]|uniref:type II secretion system protein n=1 Tax=Paraliobacillus salinarum TaxID=1158996 RepID=UPI0015F5D2D1|nr:type II secretion system protein [Paraliobacillus salinarum]
MSYNDQQKGFVLTEVIIAFSLIIILSTSVIPIFYQIGIEQKNLYDKREIQSHLHDQLIINASNDSTANIYKTIKVKQTEVRITLSFEEPLWKGCANWIDAKNKNEEICLFYYP